MTHHITGTSQSHTKKKKRAPTYLCAAGDPRPTGLLVVLDTRNTGIEVFSLIPLYKMINVSTMNIRACKDL